ncbi:MAG: hypothetical protein HND53_07445 [Proteobacteria bacterium]|nr:hypothetical protein [Pseudomonadota bacterium]NOG60316.1 hypothetical protein [Pseudomonadota bacterium]
MQPRLIRLRDMPMYLGMDRNRFNNEFRNKLTEVPIGIQGIAFDRKEVDRLIDDFINKYGRPPKEVGETTWDANQHKNSPDSSNAAISGISTKGTNTRQAVEFEKALAKATSTKRKTS